MYLPGPFNYSFQLVISLEIKDLLIFKKISSLINMGI